jgi:hypothetical protein
VRRGTCRLSCHSSSQSISVWSPRLRSVPSAMRDCTYFHISHSGHASPEESRSSRGAYRIQPTGPLRDFRSERWGTLTPTKHSNNQTPEMRFCEPLKPINQLACRTSNKISIASPSDLAPIAQPSVSSPPCAQKPSDLVFPRVCDLDRGGHIPCCLPFVKYHF